MISIIVIGKNEGWRLSKCLESILQIVEDYKELKFEILYVDSQSNDDSIKRAQKLYGIRIFELSGKMNAAIARNVGAKEAIGDVLFFVDGDMELNSKFLSQALNAKGELIFQSLTGHLDDYFYNVEGEFIAASPRTYSGELPKEIQQLKTNGGIFLIKKKNWEQVHGMNTKFKVNEDIDLSIRLNKTGVTTSRLPYLITKHHTIDYRNEKRMWNMLWAGNGFYPGVLFRDHMFNQDVIKRVLRSEYTSLLLMVGLFSLFLGQLFLEVAVAAYIILLLTRTVLHTKKANSNKKKTAYFFERFVFQFFLDISFWIGFLFFYPQQNELKYKPV